MMLGTKLPEEASKCDEINTLPGNERECVPVSPITTPEQKKRRKYHFHERGSKRIDSSDVKLNERGAKSIGQLKMAGGLIGVKATDFCPEDERANRKNEFEMSLCNSFRNQSPLVSHEMEHTRFTSGKNHEARARGDMRFLEMSPDGNKTFKRENSNLDAIYKNYVASKELMKDDEAQNINRSDNLDETLLQRELEYLDQLAGELKKKYRTLEKFGVVDARENFINYKVAMDEKVNSFQEYNSYLENEVEKLESELLKAEEYVKSVTKQNEALQNDLDAVLEKNKTLEERLGRLCSSYKSNILNIKSKVLKLGLSGDNNDLRREMAEINGIFKVSLDDLNNHKEGELLENLKKLPSTSHTDLDHKNNPETLLKMKSTIKLYEELTGVKFNAIEMIYSSDNQSESRPEKEHWALETNNSNLSRDLLVFWCKHRGRRGTLQYNLIVPATSLIRDSSRKSSKDLSADLKFSENNSQVYIYKPIKDNFDSEDELPFNKKISKLSISEWHKTSVEFKREMASLFFLRLSSYLQEQY